MILEFTHYEIYDSLKKNGLIPENFTADEFSLTFKKWQGKKKRPTETTEVVDDYTEFTVVGYVACDCDDD